MGKEKVSLRFVFPRAVLCLTAPLLNHCCLFNLLTSQLVDFSRLLLMLQTIILVSVRIVFVGGGGG